MRTISAVLSKRFLSDVRRLNDPLGRDYGRWSWLCRREMLRIAVDPRILKWSLYNYEFTVARLVVLAVLLTAEDETDARAGLMSDLSYELAWRRAQYVLLTSARRRS